MVEDRVSESRYRLWDVGIPNANNYNSAWNGKSNFMTKHEENYASKGNLSFAFGWHRASQSPSVVPAPVVSTDIKLFPFMWIITVIYPWNAWDVKWSGTSSDAQFGFGIIATDVLLSHQLCYDILMCCWNVFVFLWIFHVGVLNKVLPDSNTS